MCELITADGDCSHEIKRCLLLGRKSMTNLDKHIKKQRYYFTDKSLYSLSYAFSSSHIWMWELNHKESWALRNWCFWTVVLEKTLESPLACEEIKPVNTKGNQSWTLIGRTDAKAEAPKVWPLDAKNWLIGKDPDAMNDLRQEEKRVTENEIVGQGSLACCRPWDHKESRRQLSNWTELNCSYLDIWIHIWYFIYSESWGYYWLFFFSFLSCFFNWLQLYIFCLALLLYTVLHYLSCTTYLT